MDLLATFAALPRPSTAASYSCAPESGNCRVGRSFDGHPALLVAFATNDGAKVQRRLANVAYHPPASVDILAGTGTQSAQLAIVECCTNEEQLASYFFRVVSELLMPEALHGEESRFERALDTLITLFKSLQRPGSRTLQGLWAELAMIAFSAKPMAAVSSWHSSSRALHDFSAGPLRVEVKSTIKKLREHAFLLDQLIMGTPGQVLIASLLLTETSGGCSIFDLVAVIRRRLDGATEPMKRLEQIVADSLGLSHADAHEHRYDADSARLSLSIYRAHDIPTCPLPLPPEVKEVGFTVDLSTTPVIQIHDARALAPYFADLLPSD